MNEVISDAAGSVIAKFSERYPNACLAMSLTGAGTAVLSLLKIVSIVGGAAGAVFSAIAGYYAMRSRWRQRKKEKEEDARAKLFKNSGDPGL